jgi:hypothetical protein
MALVGSLAETMATVAPARAGTGWVATISGELLDTYRTMDRAMVAVNLRIITQAAAARGEHDHSEEEVQIAEVLRTAARILRASTPVDITIAELRDLALVGSPAVARGDLDLLLRVCGAGRQPGDYVVSRLEAMAALVSADSDAELDQAAEALAAGPSCS